MRISPLPLHDALRLASLLHLYIDEKQLNPDEDALEFIDGIVQKISAQDFVLCIKIMTNKIEQDLEKMDGLDILALFSKGLRVNRVISLMGFYHSLGL